MKLSFTSFSLILVGSVWSDSVDGARNGHGHGYLRESDLYSSQEHNQTSNDERNLRLRDRVFDYIVTGAGAGGGIVASRLAEAGFKTLLLDAGPDYDTIITEAPLFWPLSTIQPEIEWAMRSKNSDAPGRDNVLYPKASMLGGCTPHNAMMTVYPYPETWNDLADLTGDSEWSEEKMRERFVEIENNQYLPPNLPGHGYDGFLHTSLVDDRLVNDPQFQDANLQATLGTIIGTYAADPSAALSPQLPILGDVNFPGVNTLEGAHFTPLSIDKEAGFKRSTVYDLIKSTEAAKDNFVVKPNSFVTKIMTWSGFGLTKPRAFGVEVAEGEGLYGASTADRVLTRRKKRYFARKEVIVAGGAFNTPQILMVSGIGPKDELEALGIRVVADVPGVGKNLQDKLEATMNFKMPEPWTLFDQGCTFLQPDPASDQCFVDYLGANFTDSPNLYTSVGVLLSVQKKSDPSLPRPDMYMQVAPLYFQGYRDGWVDQAYGSVDFLTFNTMTTTSVGNVGTVSLKSKDPFEPVSIDFNGYAEEDLDRTVAFVQELKTLAEGLQAGGIIQEIVEPGPERETTQDLKDWVTEFGWGHHACCTAKIGDDNDPMAVLDGQLKVRAVDRLRVVDLSAFPVEPGFFPMLPVYMLAEKAADDIIGSHGSRAMMEDVDFEEIMDHFDDNEETNSKEEKGDVLN